MENAASLSILYGKQKKNPALRDSPPADRPQQRHHSEMTYLFCSHVWLPTVQDVLHADWQDVWHSPHPPFFKLLFMVCVFNVFTCFMVMILLIFA